MLQHACFDDITMRGDLAYRTLKNFARMEESPYKPNAVYERDAASWPADWVGRTILALVMDARATRREPAYLQRILDGLSGYFNEKGYVGPVLPIGEFDEQQLSGHSWLLRGLCELYEWRGEESIRAMIQNIVNALVLPLKGYYCDYPIASAREKGAAAGSLTGNLIQHWYTSTDTCCAFIPLDGFSHAYTVLREKSLLPLLEEMMETFMTIDIAGIRAQTHATLSACRGFLRMYDELGDASLLDFVKKIYAFYRETAMTANGANFNWFERPEWTEPCAIVDSLMVAMALWKNTENACYLEDAHHIYYNALGFAQRPNGGFGCDTCAGGDGTPYLMPHKDIFEAFWCCSMRGGEGLARMTEYAAFTEENRVILPFYHDCTIRVALSGGTLTFVQKVGYPYSGDVLLRVIEAPFVPITFSLYLPSWAKGFRIAIDGRAAQHPAQQSIKNFIDISLQCRVGTTIHLQFDIGLREDGSGSSLPGNRLFHGPLLLGIQGGYEGNLHIDCLYADGNGRYRIHNDNSKVLVPINGMIDFDMEIARTTKYQVIF